MAFQFDTQPVSQEVVEGSSVSLDYTWSGAESTPDNIAYNFNQASPWVGDGYVSHDFNTLRYRDLLGNNYGTNSDIIPEFVDFTAAFVYSNVRVTQGGAWLSYFGIVSDTLGNIAVVFLNGVTDSIDIYTENGVVNYPVIMSNYSDSFDVYMALNKEAGVLNIRIENTANTEVIVDDTQSVSGSYSDARFVGVAGLVTSVIDGFSYSYKPYYDNTVIGSLNKDTVEIDSFSTTSSSYSYPIASMSAGDTGNYQLELTSAGNTIYSDLITLALAEESYTNTITDGTNSINVNTQYGYTTEVELSIEKALDANGIVQWIDNGSEYDNYKTIITARTKKGGELENLLSGSNTSSLVLSNNGENWLFTSLFQKGQNLPVNVVKWNTRGDDNIYGDTRSYTLEIVPRLTDIYSSLNLSGVINSCVGRNHWQIGSIQFPFANWGQVINDRRRVNVYGGSSGNLDDTKRSYGDVSTMTINCDEEQARKILQYFALTMRGTEQTAIFPSVYRIFGERYTGITTCKVKLYDNILTVTHSNVNSVDITFSLQMVGE